MSLDVLDVADEFSCRRCGAGRMPLFVLDSPELVGLWRQIGGIAFCGPQPACDTS